MRVVLADPDKSEQLLMTMACVEWGLDRQLELVSDGDSLIRALRNQHVDAVVMHSGMQTRQGKDVLALLQANRRLNHIPIVVLTDGLRPCERAACLERGAVHVEVRPDTLDSRARFLDRLALVVAISDIRQIEGSPMELLYETMADDLMDEIDANLDQAPPSA